MDVEQAAIAAKNKNQVHEGDSGPDRLMSKARLCRTRQVIVKGPHFTLRKWDATSPNFKWIEMKNGQTGKGERSLATKSVKREFGLGE